MAATLTAAATLALARDDSLDADALAARLNVTPMFAAGLIDGVEEDRFFDGAINWCEVCPAAREEYRAGLALGEQLLDEERYGEGWAEAYAVAAREAAELLASAVPADPSDYPW